MVRVVVDYELKIVARIETDFPTKFGVPRQSGLVRGLKGRIVFEPEYRDPAALRGLEGFSHIWLLWDFSEVRREGTKCRPTVRPPRLGGNRRMGVWATRSPFRPNPVGLSSVRLLSVTMEEGLGPVLTVEGADLVDGTPIYDIKPYLPYADSHPEARSGFATGAPQTLLGIDDPSGALQVLPPALREGLVQSLAQDPRPHYQEDPDRVYSMLFDDYDVHFKVSDGRVTVTGVDVKKS